MDSRPVVWDAYNRRHLTEDHPERAITTAEVEEAMHDPERLEVAIERPDGIYYSVLGVTKRQRLLFLAYVDHAGGRYPVHARQAGRKLSRRYYGDE